MTCKQIRYTVKKSEVKLCTSTELCKELYASTGHCVRRYDGADHWNGRKRASFIHAVVVRVVNGVAQTCTIQSENFSIAVDNCAPSVHRLYQ